MNLADAACLERALVLAPIGRDATLAIAILREAGLAAESCNDLTSLVRELGLGAGFALVTEEALHTADLHALAGWIAGQPPWSDLPIIVLTTRGGGPERNPGAQRLMAALGNVTLLERPFHPSTLASVARTALRSRERQYVSRGQLEELAARQATLAAREEQLRFVLTAGRLGSWELDIGAGAFSCSTICKEHFGRAPGEPLTYADMLAAIHPDDHAGVRAIVGNALSRNTDFAVTYRVVWRDRSLHWVELRGQALREPGQRGRMAGVSLDVTARKQAEEDLRRSREHLEERVTARTAELADALDRLQREIEDRQRVEDSLRQSQKMEAIGQLTGGIAHDFNNLLTGITGSLELLQIRAAKGQAADVGRFAETAMMAAKRAAALTHRLLAFSRRQTLDPQPTALNELVAGIVELIRRTVGPTITVETILVDGLWPTLCDANQLETALLNLAINARDAMPEGGRLTIETANTHLDESHVHRHGDELQPGDYVAVAVSDTGIGMPPQVIARAFEPFYTTKPIGLGTGLGLSMVYGFVNQSSGQVRIESTVGQGTTVKIHLPRWRGEVVTAERQAEQHRVGQAAAGVTVLVVDDESVVRMLAREVLDELGYATLEAEDGPSALRILKSGTRIDLLVTDVGMPGGMNGRQLADAARVARPELLVLFITGYAETASTAPDFLAPGMEIMTKPFTLDALAARISRMVAAIGIDTATGRAAGSWVRPRKTGEAIASDEARGLRP
jgi:PAS domain S-box-containing protein